MKLSSGLVRIGYSKVSHLFYDCPLCTNPVYASENEIPPRMIDGVILAVHDRCKAQYTIRHNLSLESISSILDAILRDFGSSGFFTKKFIPVIEKTGEKFQPTEEEILKNMVRRNYDIAVKSSGLRRAAAIYRLWRNLGVSYYSIAAIMRNRTGEEWSASMVEHICTELFTYLCNTSDTCVFRPMLGPMTSPPKCKLDGCDALVLWCKSKRSWYSFCSKAHRYAYIAQHRPIFYGSVCRLMLSKIRSGEVQYQSQTPLNPRNRSRICGLLESRGLIKRSKVLHNGRWTYRLEPLATAVKEEVL